MGFIGCKKFSVLKSIMVLFFLAVILTSCSVTIPDYPEVPKDMETSQMAQVKLITTNADGFNERFGGIKLRMFFLVPYGYKHRGAISFNKDYTVYVDGDWETSNGKFWSTKYKFNDKAVFSIPAGTYEACAHKLGQADSDVVITKCYSEKFTFEPGQKYEMYVYYSTETQTVYKPQGVATRYIWYLKVSEIKKVDEFKPTQMFMEK